MNKKSFIQIMLPVCLLTGLFILNSCGEDTVNAPQDFVSGTITYLDTNMNYSSGYYAVCVYGDSSSPFSHNPLRIDSLAVSISGGTATAYYKIEGLASGNYYIASVMKNRTSGAVTVYGVLGCDENINCPAPTKITVPNYAGTGGLNFKSLTH